ncbi:MAG: hypothetical protein WC332_00440 [Clostridia bacterium]|jgi:hypothetical protein
MDDSILILQIAYSVVGDSPEWMGMSSGARLEEIRRVYHEIENLIDGVPPEKDTSLN